MAAVVAQRVESDGTRRGRTLDERAIVRFPGIYRWLGKFFLRLSPRSRLRQWLVRRQVVSGWDASSRDDFELMQIRYGDDLVFEWNPELVTLGLPPRVEGHENWRREITDFRSTWVEWQYWLVFVIDFGDRLLTLGRAQLRGRASGADVEIGFAQLIDHRDGVVRHERDFTKWPEALLAAGLDSAVLSRLDSLPRGAAMEL